MKGGRRLVSYYLHITFWLTAIKTHTQFTMQQLLVPLSLPHLSSESTYITSSSLSEAVISTCSAGCGLLVDVVPELFSATVVELFLSAVVICGTKDKNNLLTSYSGHVKKMSFLGWIRTHDALSLRQMP